MCNVLLLAHVQWNKGLFTPMPLVLLGCKSQRHFWALDHCYLSDKWFEYYLAGALPVPGRTFLTLTYAGAAGSEDWPGTSTNKHLLAGTSFGDSDSLLAQMQGTPCLLVYVPRHPQLTGIGSGQCF